MEKENIIREKSADFALRIVNVYKFLSYEKKERIMSKQLIRSGTSIGANVEESVYAQSKADFVSKLSISLKETAETEYWLRLLYRSGYLTEEEYSSVYSDAEEIRKILVSIINTMKEQM